MLQSTPALQACVGRPSGEFDRQVSTCGGNPVLAGVLTEGGTGPGLRGGLIDYAQIKSS